MCGSSLQSLEQGMFYHQNLRIEIPALHAAFQYLATRFTELIMPFVPTNEMRDLVERFLLQIDVGFNLYIFCNGFNQSRIILFSLRIPTELRCLSIIIPELFCIPSLYPQTTVFASSVQKTQTILFLHTK